MTVEWIEYKRKGVIPLRPYAPGESLETISVSPTDEPQEGGMVARDPKNPNDQWYVNQDYFKKNYELA